MKELIKLRTRLCFLTVIVGTVFLANPTLSLAQAPEGKQAGAKPAGPTLVSKDSQLQAIQARAKGAAAKLNPKDPKAFKQANAELAGIHADLVAYARKIGLKLTTKTYTKRGGAIAEQSCASTSKNGNLECTLTKATLNKDGNLHCYYDCVVPPEMKKE